MKLNRLTQAEAHVILDKGTEAPYSNQFDHFFVEGMYFCRQCDAPLYVSNRKFNSHCGWPAFDQALPNAVKQLPDADGQRTEIQCNTCGGHLGHVFIGEEFTETNQRHCVNSISMQFIPIEKLTPEQQNIVHQTEPVKEK